MRNTIAFSMLIVVQLLVCGCSRELTMPSLDNGSIESGSVIKELTFNLGTLESDHVFDCLIGGEYIKTVKKIIRSCGCVGPNIIDGEILDFNEPFKISVTVTGKPMGPGLQNVLIYFEDESAVQITVNYVYLPLPTYSPTNIIFKQNEIEKTLCFVFPQESDVTLSDISVPSFFVCSQTTELQDGTLTIHIKFTLDRSKLEDEKDGTIHIASSSKRKPEFTVPYLILLH